MLLLRSFRIIRGFRLVLLLQIGQCFLFVPGAALFGFGDKLISPDPILINFPRRYNGSRIPTRYLPPEIPNSDLPEVIDNRAKTAGFTEPNEINVLSIPGFQLQPPSQNVIRDSRFYLQPVYAQTKNTNFITNQASPIKELNMSFGSFKINEMSCQNTPDELFFRVSIKTIPPLEIPVIENVGSDSCKIFQSNDEYQINFGKDQFWNCGVVDCSTELDKFYCLNLRFPVISGLRLKDDMKITLQCKVQERIASHTKQITVKTLDTTARMAPGVITGGSKNTFDTDIALFRKTYNSENIFDTKIQPGGTVILGEEILLRVVVKEGDGWRYSRISDVNIHFVEKQHQKKIMNSIWILDSNGCLNPDVRDICSREQYKHSPLETYLIFQAFMFESMKESDEMILSVKVTGCLDGTDCVLNCPGGHTRRSRSIDHHNQTTNWQDDITFRVAYPKMQMVDSNNSYLIVLCILFSLTIISIITLLWVIKSFLWRKSSNKY